MCLKSMSGIYKVWLIPRPHGVTGRMVLKLMVLIVEIVAGIF